MPLLTDLLSLKAELRPGQRLLGLDTGEKTIGLALSDRGLMIATPMQTIRRGKFAADLQILAAIITEQNVGGLILGLPINMDGSEGPRSQSVRQFARNILKQIDLPIVLWDERLSTMAVTRLLIEADTSRARRAELVDKMAAAYILQGALDRMAQGAG
ncbi:MAG TPA: Holliday junction resolvase RuvX [Alphaproteobacteria bacterium]|nr:Holliday junction resolvase RuvX [Alphaproteobacteria bacterium]